MQPVISSKQAEHATASGQNIGPHSAYPLIAELIRQFGVSPPSSRSISSKIDIYPFVTSLITAISSLKHTFGECTIAKPLIVLLFSKLHLSTVPRLDIRHDHFCNRPDALNLLGL